MPKSWIFFLLLVPLYLTWTFDHSLWNPDETRDAGVAREMFRTGDYIVPKLNGEPFLEKPPLYYWTTAFVYKFTGHISSGTTRLPSALYGIMGILFTFLIGKTLFDEQAAFFSASILALSAQYFRMSHFALMDVTLAALVTGALYFHLKGDRWIFIFMTILAFYAKGFLGVALAGLVVTLHYISERKVKELGVTIGLGALAFVVLVGPWFYGLWKAGGNQYLKIFLIDNHWHRYFSEASDHSEHFWFFYFLSFPVDFLPGTFVFVAHLRHSIRNLQAYLNSESHRFLLIWFWVLFLFFTLSSSKRSIYLLPLFPAASLLSGVWLSETINKKNNPAVFRKWIFGIFSSLGLLLGGSSFLLASRLDRDKSFLPIVDSIRKIESNAVIAGYEMSEMERGVFGFYFNRILKNPVTPEELERFFSIHEVEPVALIVNRNKVESIKTILHGRAKLVYEHRPGKRTRSYLVYRNKVEDSND